jgi:hypothetical protein|tara:strand:- start:262 stop:1149 length:888 start_codon:yes stop_codon:yes gene_type:complete
MLTKDEYLLRNFSKIKHKKWELFVITRVLHLLDDPEIEYVCQQYINIKGNRHYLTDLCFPTLKLYLEINEGQHASKQHVESDKIRQREILEATDWEQKNIDVYDEDNPAYGRDLNEVVAEIDDFIAFVKKRKKEFETAAGEKIRWDYENKFNPERFIKKGCIELKDNVVFLTHRDCLRLFGYKKKGHLYRAWWEVGTRDFNQAVWFPKLYPNKEWRNVLSQDRLTISEERVINGSLVKINPPAEKDRIVFAHYKNVFGQTVYKFFGIYRTDFDSTTEFKHVHRRIETKIDLTKYI